MNPQVIKSFLVSINYKVDGSSENRFKASVGSATKLVLGLAAAALAASTAIVAGVTRMSRSMDDLYWASQRTGSSVASIRALQYAASQMGTTAEDARASLEGLAERIRTNPGYGSLVRGLIGNGVDLRNSEQVLQRLGARFRQMAASGPQGYAIANQYAQQLGISEPMLQAIIRNMDRFNADYRRRLRLFGVDSDAAARAGQGVMRSVRETQSNLQILGERILLALGPQVQAGFDNFNRWLERNHERVVRFIQIILRFILRLGETLSRLFTDENMGSLEAGFDRIIGGLEAMIEWFEKGNNAVDLLKAGLGAFLVYVAGTWAVSLIRAFSMLTAGISATGAGGLLMRLLRIGAVGGVAAGVLLPSGGNNERQDLEEFRRDPEGFQRRLREQENTNRVVEGSRSDADRIIEQLQRLFGVAPAAASTLPAGNLVPGPRVGRTPDGPTPTTPEHTERSNRLMRKLMQDFGFTAAQAAGIVGNLDHESGLAAINERNPLIPGSRGGFGYAQWTASRRTAFERWAQENGLDIRSEEANYGFLAHELRNTPYGRAAVARLMGTSDPRSAAQAFLSPFLTGGDPRAVLALGSRLPRADAALGRFNATLGASPGQPGNVVINQTTTITVPGSSDPNATARAVGREMGRVNADLDRNMRGSVR